MLSFAAACLVGDSLQCPCLVWAACLCIKHAFSTSCSLFSFPTGVPDDGGHAAVARTGRGQELS